MPARPLRNVNPWVVGGTILAGVALLVWAAGFDQEADYYVVDTDVRVTGDYLMGLLTSLGSAVLLIPVLELISAVMVRRAVDQALATRGGGTAQAALDSAIRRIGQRFMDAGWTQVTRRDHRATGAMCFAKEATHIGISWRDGQLAVHRGCAHEAATEQVVGAVADLAVEASDREHEAIARLEAAADPALIGQG